MLRHIIAFVAPLPASHPSSSSSSSHPSSSHPSSSTTTTTASSPLGGQYTALRFDVAGEPSAAALAASGADASPAPVWPLTIVIPFPGVVSSLAADDSLTLLLDGLEACFPHSVAAAAPVIHDAEAGAVAPGAGAAAPAAKRARLAVALAEEEGAHSEYRHTARVLDVAAAAALLAGEGDRAALVTRYAGCSVVAVSVKRPEGTTYEACELAALHGRVAPDKLWVPLRVTLAGGADGGGDADADVPAPPALLGADAHVYSIGTARRADWSGGGKSSLEAYEDARHRLAAGSFRRCVPSVLLLHWVHAPPPPHPLVHQFQCHLL